MTTKREVFAIRFATSKSFLTELNEVDMFISWDIDSAVTFDSEAAAQVVLDAVNGLIENYELDYEFTEGYTDTPGIVPITRHMVM